MPRAGFGRIIAAILHVYTTCLIRSYFASEILAYFVTYSFPSERVQILFPLIDYAAELIRRMSHILSCRQKMEYASLSPPTSFFPPPPLDPGAFLALL